MLGRDVSLRGRWGIGEGKSFSVQIAGSILRLLVPLVFLSGQINPLAVAPAAAAPPGQLEMLSTIGDFLGFGNNLIDDISDAIQTAGSEVRGTLTQLRGDIEHIIGKLEATYQENLNVTINSLDAAIQNQFRRLERLFEQVNAELQKTVTHIADESIRVLEAATTDMRDLMLDLEQSLTNVIVVGGETAAYVIDRSVYNVLLVVSLLLFAGGLLLFIWMLYTKKLPAKKIRNWVYGGMAVYLLLFSALALVPPFRAYAMAYSGIGLRDRLEKAASDPRIAQVLPEQVVLGETTELQIWGSNLRPDGHAPDATLGGKPVRVRAASDRRIVLDLAGLELPPGSAELVLGYGPDDALQEVVPFARPTPTMGPADLVITDLRLEPESPVAGSNTHVVITILNRGARPAGDFAVSWRPTASDMGTAQSINLEGLGPGEQLPVAVDYAYPSMQEGRQETLAIVDVDNEVPEGDESNNSTTRVVTVRQGGALVTVDFSKITQRCSDEARCQFSLGFDINGVKTLFPRPGHGAWVRNDVGFLLDVTPQVLIQENEPLSIRVWGMDRDLTTNVFIFDWLAEDTYDWHTMGEVKKSYEWSNDPATAWGAGIHKEMSSCNDGCFTIEYTINYDWIK